MGVQNHATEEGKAFENLMNNGESDWKLQKPELPEGYAEALLEVNKAAVLDRDRLDSLAYAIPVAEMRGININGIGLRPEYYLGIAKSVAHDSTCIRRSYGAILVKNKRIVATGYNGAPCGRKHCTDIGECYRIKHNIPSGKRYEACRSTHAEMNVIISASKEEMEGSDLYLIGIEQDGSISKNADCCSICKRLIINAGIKRVCIATGIDPLHDVYTYEVVMVEDWINNDDSLYEHEGY